VTEVENRTGHRHFRKGKKGDDVAEREEICLIESIGSA